MARRVSWTNNSSGHSGTYVYRAPTLDPQNLPAPVVTVDPVAQGETAEWIDNSGEYGCFAVQDFDGQGVGTLSAEVCVTDPFDGVAVGDSVQGGVYAGNLLINGTNYHIISGDAGSEALSTEWALERTVTGATDHTDGLANTNIMIGLGLSGFPAASHCVSYGGGGFTDWYFPAINELVLINDNLKNHPEFSDNVASAASTWSSTEDREAAADYRKFNTETTSSNLGKESTIPRVRPIRRVAV